jgi:hypothetical protein
MLSELTYKRMLASFNDGELWEDGFSDSQIELFFDRLFGKA